MEFFLAAGVLISVIGAMAFLLVYKKSGSGTFLYLCICSILVLISSGAAMVGSISPALVSYTGPLVDMSLGLFGFSMAVASCWLVYTFKLAGERYD